MKKELKKLTHIDQEGKAYMVDIGAKPITRRIAVASCRINLAPETIKLILENKVKKGEVLNTARIAGINAAKKTFELIPLAHPIPLDQIEIEIEILKSALKILCTVKTQARTGAEMEALTGAGVCALSVYDMVKAVDRGAEITDLRLEYKAGGKSGRWKKGAGNE
jgi:cyclic pyranopterin phosphate synthase